MQDLQLPPAFCLSQTQLIARAIELAYERDYTHIPYVSLSIDRQRLTQYTYPHLRKQPPLNGGMLKPCKTVPIALSSAYMASSHPRIPPVLRPATFLVPGY